MAKLLLTPVEIVALGGPEARMQNEIAGGIPNDLFPEQIREQIQDLGLVEYDGHSYYATLYNPPPVEDAGDCDED